MLSTPTFGNSGASLQNQSLGTGSFFSLNQGRPNENKQSFFMGGIGGGNNTGGGFFNSGSASIFNNNSTGGSVGMLGTGGNTIGGSIGSSSMFFNRGGIGGGVGGGIGGVSQPIVPNEGTFVMRPEMHFLTNPLINGRNETNYSQCHIAKDKSWEKVTTTDLRIQDYKVIDSYPINDVSAKQMVQNLAKNAHINPKIFSERTQKDLFENLGTLGMGIGQQPSFISSGLPGTNNTGGIGMGGQPGFLGQNLGSKPSFFGQTQGQTGSFFGTNSSTSTGFFGQGTGTQGGFFGRGIGSSNNGFFGASQMGGATIGQSPPSFGNQGTLGGMGQGGFSIGTGQHSLMDANRFGGPMSMTGGLGFQNQGINNGMGTMGGSFGTFGSLNNMNSMTFGQNRFQLGGGLGGMNNQFFGNQNQGFMRGGLTPGVFFNQGQMQGQGFNQIPVFGLQNGMNANMGYPQVLSSLNQEELLSQIAQLRAEKKALTDKQDEKTITSTKTSPGKFRPLYFSMKENPRTKRSMVHQPPPLPKPVLPSPSPSPLSSKSHSNYFQINNRITILQDGSYSHSNHSASSTKRSKKATPLRNLAMELAKSTYGSALTMEHLGKPRRVYFPPRSFSYGREESIDGSFGLNTSIKERPGTRNQNFLEEIVPIEVTYLFTNGIEQETVRIHRQKTVEDAKQWLLMRIKDSHLSPGINIDGLEKECSLMIGQSRLGDKELLSSIYQGRGSRIDLTMSIPIPSAKVHKDFGQRSSTMHFERLENDEIGCYSSPFPEALSRFGHEDPFKPNMLPEHEISFSFQNNAEDLAPILEKSSFLDLIPEVHSDLKTTPSVAALNSMPEERKSKVHDLIIENSFGKMYFPGFTDTRGIDFDKDVVISQFVFDVYPDESRKPAIGQGLNKECLLTFKEIYKMNQGSTDKEFLLHLIEMAEEQGAEFISYRPETKEWTIKVQNFE